MGCAQLKIVEVLWEDSQNWGGWRQKDSYNFEETMLCRTVGYFVKKTDKYLCLAQSENEPSWDNIMQIPQSAIKKIKNLGKVDNWSKK